MKDIINNLNTHNKAIQEQLEKENKLISKYEKLIEYHQKRVDKLEYQNLNWVDGIVKPLAEKIAKRFNLYYDIYGPFGLDCQTSIYWSDKPEFDICKDRKIKITLYPRNYGKGQIDYWTGEETNQYPKGSIGELNGFNYVKASLPLDIKEIIKLLRGDRTLLGKDICNK